MKKLYSLTTFAIALTLFSLSSSAQSGGTYTALRPGNWHAAGTPSDLPIWQGSEPPKNCSNCVITLNVNGTIVLNTNVNLSNSSSLILGGNAGTTVLSIGNSGASDFDHSFSIIMINDGSSTNMSLADGNAILNANLAGTYDGILTSFTSSGSTSYFKQVGNAPSGFVGTTIASTATPAYSKTLLGPVTLSSTGTLPILLSDFEVALDNNNADLTWTTQIEVNSDHFVIQRSTNSGANWDNIGTVTAHGNSSTPLNYSYTDNKVAAGTSEYRLQMVDKDGKFAYSTVKTVRNGLIGAVSVFPNPAHDYVNVTLAGTATNATIRLFNQTGQLLQERSISNAAGSTVALAVNTYPQGNYLVVITSPDGSKQVTNLLITK